ncbi:putative transmembrane sensor histidine kinase transcription regulator protein [Achromobacter arsenitoxydans SY8]|uniref:Putative transmembrane sensor histidine kinase transcription regulator protein n=2 Tax=Achromobacter TaxID=222 RepID=H0FFA4_9BURK|nr:putative transmembrane sensor histidine kinase transcription regulator protein [Achromobacter arsenitoxydans SY8]
MAVSDGVSMISTSIGGELSQGESAPGFWRAQVVGWIFLAFVGYFIRLAVFGNAVAAFWLTLALEPLAFILTSVAAMAHGRLPSGQREPVIVLAGSVLLCVAASALLASIAYAINHLFLSGIREIPGNQYWLGFIYYMGILSIWTLIYFGVSAELAARTERLHKMKAETRSLRLELEHLQLQVEPHFLFNALNTIVAEIGDRPAVAEEMTRRLAEYLRYSLDRRGRGLCRLEEDIEAAQAYIRIQALRFDKKLDCRCQIDPATLKMQIPHMTLQGLAENAIKHGMRGEHERFVIHIRTRLQGEALVIEVTNPGILQAPFDLVESGGGLGNLCRRLALRYPDRYEFSLDQRGDLTVAEIRLRGEPAPL